MNRASLYELIDVFTLSEYQFIKSLITQHVESKLGISIDLATYHQQVSPCHHQSLASKKERVLSQSDALRILDLPGMRKLIDIYRDYQISSVVYDSNTVEDRPEFYFRLVRPSCASDVGQPHCDYWFDQAMGTKFGRGNTIKLWLPIVLEPGKNGLAFYPDSPADTPFLIKSYNGLMRPVLDCPLSELGTPVLPQPAYGQAIKFHDHILHCGALNTGSTTRVSMEITLVRKK